jgi:hypothetical protein
MGSPTPLRRLHKQHIALLAIAFFLSRALAFWAGMRYLGNESQWLIQLLSLDILHHHLFRGLLHLHAQPPLFNLLIGLALKTGGPAFGWVVLAVQMLIGLAAGIAVYLTLTTLGVKPWISLAVSLLLLLNPSAILYEFDALYTSLVYALQCFIALAASRYVIARSSAALYWLAALAVTLTLLRSSYQWLELLAIFALLYFQMPSNRRQIMKAGLAAVFLSLLWPAKNYVLFHHFTSSTWGPYSLSRMWRGSPVIAAHPDAVPTMLPSASVDIQPWLRTAWQTTPTGFPELDDIAKDNVGATNWNSLAMLRMRDAQSRDLAYLARHDPATYLHHVSVDLFYYFQPTTDYFILNDPAKFPFWQPSWDLYNKLEPIDRPLRRICCNIFGFRPPYSSAFAGKATLWWRIRGMAAGSVLLYAIAFACLVSFALCKPLWAAHPDRRIVLSLMILTIAYAFVVYALLEFGENMRFRYETDALVAITATVFLQQVWDRRRPSSPDEPRRQPPR